MLITTTNCLSACDATNASTFFCASFLSSSNLFNVCWVERGSKVVVKPQAVLKLITAVVFMRKNCKILIATFRTTYFNGDTRGIVDNGAAATLKQSAHAMTKVFKLHITSIVIFSNHPAVEKGRRNNARKNIKKLLYNGMFRSKREQRITKFELCAWIIQFAVCV